MRRSTGAIRRGGLVLVVVLSSLALAACGGGGDGGGVTGTSATPVISSGTVTQLGSITVNGIRFEDTAANITGDDTAKVLADVRKLGATVKISGRLNGDGTTGIADRIEIENEVRGPIGTITPPDSFTVLGQTVFVDGGTVFANVANFGALAAGDNVEVSGARDAAGNIRATRVEKFGIGAAVVDEVKGTITVKTGIASGTITVGGVIYTFDAGTVIAPTGAAFVAGTLVEIHIDAGTSRANRIEVEDLDEAGFVPGAGQETEVEGFVSGFTSLSNTFLVAGQTVDASNARLEGGINTDMANNVKVEAEGQMVGGILVADKIAFKDALRVSANVTAKTTDSITVVGKTVFVNARTTNFGQFAALAIGNGVLVRGFLNADNTTITATGIDTLGQPVQADQNLIQGLVASFNATTRHLSILGFDVDASGGTVQFQGDEDVPLTATQFFAALTSGKTVVKARGTVSGISLVANQAEIE